MVFSTKDDLKAKRTISEKMLINTWKYRNNFESSIAAMSKAGFKYANIGIWVNLVNGIPDFTGEIEKIQKALDICKKYSIKPMINFNSQNNGYFDTSTSSNFTKEQLDVIKQNLSEIFKTFAKQGIIWANINEPDNVYWASYDQRHNSSVISSWVNFSKWWISETFNYDDNALNVAYSALTSIYDEASDIAHQAVQQGLFRRALGGVSHPYVSQDISDGQPEVMMQLHEGTVGGVPLLSNEYGYSRVGEQGDSWQGQWTMREAAKLTARQTIIQDYLGFSIIGIYCDLGNSYNIENSDFTLNQVGSMTMDLVNKLEDYTIQEKIEVVTHDSYLDDIYIFRYSRNDCIDKLVYWAPEKVGTQKLFVNNKMMELTIDDYPKVIDFDGIPNPKEYFVPIRSNTSLGTEVLY